MSISYLFIIAAIVVVSLIFMLVLRGRIVKRTEGVVEGRSAEEAMNDYLNQTVTGYNPADFQVAYGWVMAKYDINRVFAYNSNHILVVPVKLLHGELTMPDNQEMVVIDLDTVDHLFLFKRGSNSGVRVYFDNEKNTDNFYDLDCVKKDVCGNDNIPDFMKFVSFMENWAKEHNIPVEE